MLKIALVALAILIVLAIIVVAVGRADTTVKDAPTYTPPGDASSDWVLWVSDGTNLNEGANFPSPGASLTRVVVDRQSTER